MLMLLFVSVMHRLMTSIAQKMSVYQFLLPQSGSEMLNQVYLSFFFQCFVFWSQECASVGILCILISCFSQSKLGWHGFFMAC